MKSPSENLLEPSDSELLLAAGLGDRDAFRDLYRRISKTLFSVAYKVVGNTADAEELTQETFMELWKQAPRYDAERAKPLTFAIRIIRNRSIDRIRKKTRQDAIMNRSVDAILESSQSSNETGAVESASLSEISVTVKAAFETLSEDQRVALQLAYFGGLSQSEIAEKQSEALGTIKSRMRRGLDKLRKELEGKL